VQAGRDLLRGPVRWLRGWLKRDPDMIDHGLGPYLISAAGHSGWSRLRSEERMMKNMATGKKILLVLLMGLAFILLVELLARLTAGPRWLNQHYVTISSDFAELDALINDTQNTAGLQYYDEFLYAMAPYSSTHVNFTDYYSARLTPGSVPLAKAEQIVWTFGGSTMENTETTDSLTIANTWARLFNESLGPTHIKNFGTGGFFSSYELIKFQKLLREVPEDELPTMAIFYDGYNDALFGFQYGPGNLQKDLSLKLQALVEYDNLTTGTYAISRGLARYSRFWERTGARFVEHWLFTLPEPSTATANLEAAVHIYTSNVRMIQATCQLFEIRCYFVLQPLLLTKTPLSQVEQEVLDGLEAHPRFGPEGSQFMRDFYSQAAQELSGYDFFIDASYVLNGRTQSDFYDPGHVSAQTPPIIGEAIARLILAQQDAGGEDHE
jgi:hypothetical protein